MALTPLQYRSHIDRNLNLKIDYFWDINLGAQHHLGCPPMSQSLMVTLPFVIFLMLKPTVGIMSWDQSLNTKKTLLGWFHTSLNCPEEIRLTKVVFPACCKTKGHTIAHYQSLLGSDKSVQDQLTWRPSRVQHTTTISNLFSATNWKYPEKVELTWRPTRVSSISSFQKRDCSQAKRFLNSWKQ